ncbi:5172_t:CDS:1, partial [Funneliformis mosseae]
DLIWYSVVPSPLDQSTPCSIVPFQLHELVKYPGTLVNRLR